MDNFDLRKFLAEGKLHEEVEALSQEEVMDMAGMVADAFTEESADRGDYLRYSPSNVRGMHFELDTDVTEMTPEDLDTMGVGEGWGGSFHIKALDNGYEIRNSEKGGLVATMDAEGFKMLSADEARAEMGLEEAEEAPKSSKIKKSELKEMIKAAMLAETAVDYDPDQEQEDDEDEIFMPYDDEGRPLGEATSEEVELEDTADVDVEADVEMDAEPEVDGIDVKQDADAELSGTVGDVQDNLEAALEAARSLGDEKLVDQIGNTLTFFTRTHVVK